MQTNPLSSGHDDESVDTHVVDEITDRARDAADALRRLAHLRIGRPSMTPADLDIVLAHLAETIVAVPQVANQLSSILDRSRDTHLLAKDGMTTTTDPGLAVDTARLHLDAVRVSAFATHRHRNRARNEVAHLNATTLVDATDALQVSEAMPAQWLAQIADERGNGTAQAARKVLGNTLAHAERQGALAASVMSRVQTPSASTGTPGDRKCVDPDCDLDCGKRHLDTKRAFTEAEARHLFSVVEACDDADISDLLQFLFGTGVRIREALEGVSWNDVDLPAGTVRVRGTKTRSADRTLSLSTELAGRLERRALDWGRTGLVFGTTRFGSKRGQPREVGNVLKAVRGVLTEAGLSWAGSHTFRRTVATWMDASGAPLAEIANQLGHADVNTTAGYLGRRQAPTRAATVMALGPERPSLSLV
jgi:site-specific recombinase XerD